MASPATFRLSLFTWIKALIILGMFAAAWYFFPQLPEQIPTHWNFAGQPDSYSPKMVGVLLLPFVALGMAVTFPLLRRLDPKKENYASFAETWEILQLGFVGFMAYVYGVQLLAALSPEQSAFVGRYVIFGIGALFILLGNYMGRIRQNFFIGLRTPWSLSDPEVWQKSQRFGGWTFVIGGIATMGTAFFLADYPWIFFIIIVPMVVLPMAYSYLIFRKQKHITALLLACLFVIAAIAVGIRLASSEDDWVCANGTWVQHGHPTSAQPTSPCP